MKYKMVVSDYDGTLCNSKRKITKRTKQAIYTYCQNGGKFILCTTRPYISTRHIAKDLNLKDEIIVSQGSSIYNLENDKLEFSKVLKQEDIKEILDYFHYKTTQIYLLSDYYGYTNFYNFFTEVCVKLVEYPIKRKNDNLYEKMSHFNYNQVIVGSIIPSYIKYLTKSANEHFNGKYNISVCDKNLLNVTPRGVSKGSGIEFLRKKYGFNKSEIVAIGDTKADITMFDYAGHSVAMGNAMSSLKDQAEFVCDTNDNDGLAKFIEKYCI